MMTKDKHEQQGELFKDTELPALEQREPPLKNLSGRLWTECKAKLIERYLYYFEMITHHGTYIDGFAGPQYSDQPNAWAANLVVNLEPRWFRHFHLCDKKAGKYRALEKLKDSQPEDPKREIRLYHKDFNEAVFEVLDSGITEREATFCLLDQHTFECHWDTVRALAEHKQDGKKIELFYFFPEGWIDRAAAPLRNKSIIAKWWGNNKWDRVLSVTGWKRAMMMRKRFMEELGYKSAYFWPIFNNQRAGRVMYYMIHATDHMEAPKLMYRAYERALQGKESQTQLQMQLKGFDLKA